MKPATLATFEATYALHSDPWRTFSARDEAMKRRAVLRALGAGRWGRLLELGAGAGANSVPLADRSLRLDATDGADASVRLIDRALGTHPRARARARALRLALPAVFPRPVYDAIVIAELLYYLPAADMAAVARETHRRLRPGGRLVLAHHHVDFHDFAQHAAPIHRRFVSAVGGLEPLGPAVRTARWRVEAFVRRRVLAG